ncbi:MAG: hypothetical protein H0V94_08595 [Actinobacteria bacterium]|nr:hypothetical protein [Actinomycetota bacterium]
MTTELFVLALVTGAALLALWLDQRLPVLAPAGLRTILLHGALAFVALQLIPGGENVPGGAYLVLFGIALPALVYVFLVGIWFIRHAQAALSLGSR